MIDLPQQFLASVLADVASACRAVAGVDMSGIPLYIQWASAFASPRATCGGFTDSNLDLAIRSTLPAGEWRGRGFGFVLNDAVIVEAVAKMRRPLTLFRRFAVAIGLHELCHCLLDGPPTTAPSPAVAATYVEDIKHYIITDAPAIAKIEHHHHGADFIRTCAHVLHRARMAGVWPQNLECETLCDTLGSYDLAPFVFYLVELGNEPQRRIDEPIKSILNTPAPTSFSNFCEADAERRRLLLYAA